MIMLCDYAGTAGTAAYTAPEPYVFKTYVKFENFENKRALVKLFGHQNQRSKSY